MRQSFHEIVLASPGRGFQDFTEQIQTLIRQSGLSQGLATIHLQHTSASLLIQENADPDVRRDLESFMNRLIPDGDPLFVHTSEGQDDMPAHVRTALTSVNLSVPFMDKRLALGTWQGIYLWEHRHHAHRRRVAVHLLGE